MANISFETGNTTVMHSQKAQPIRPRVRHLPGRRLSARVAGGAPADAGSAQDLSSATDRLLTL
jgi:hypothetical protein